MSIYTKRGDKGQTLIIKRGKTIKLPKSSQQIATIGAIDELNSYLGIVVVTLDDEGLADELEEIQKNLLTIGSIIGGSDLRFFHSKTKKLERAIDKLDKGLASLNQFIIPGGSIESSHLHFARTLTRKAEREVVKLNKTSPVKPQIITFFNRLSDYLFVLARGINVRKGIKDRVWVRSKK